MSDDVKQPYWEVSKKTGNKRLVTFDAQGNKQYGEVVKSSNYDVADEEARAKALEKGYEFIDASPEFKYKDKTVGAQTQHTGYKVDTESGFYYKDVKPGKAGLDDFMRRHKDIIDTYDGGAEKWKADQTSARGKENPAMTHVVNEINKRHKDISGHDLVDPNKRGAYLPGVELFNLPGISKKPAAKVPGTVVKEPEADRGPIQRNTPVPYTESKKAPWWLQDIIKLSGAIGDKARIKKYNPWQATPEVRLPEATFYDPTRELAANTEMANMALQNSAAFTSPQQQAAANSVAQGQMAKSAADVLGRYNNLNVGVANQLSKEQTNIMNVASQNKANLDTQLWDKYTIANQQFDNANAQARQNIRQSYIDAITNRANTANLNSLYPQYAVDPSRGGFAYFKNPRAVDPTLNQANNKAKFREAMELTGNAKDALKYMELVASGKISPDDPTTYPNGYQG